MKIPYQDLINLHRPLAEQLTAAVADVIASGQFAGGPQVDFFEESFAGYCGSRYAIGVGSATEALWLSLLACDIGPGDEVITVANTYIATLEAIVLTGATPVFIDVEEDTLLMNPSLLSDALTPRTRAIIPVHLFGQMARMEEICDFASHHSLRVIEDASQAHGARRFNRSAGTFADLGCFSFHPSKNLGALGDAGVVITDNRILAERLRALKEHGQLEKNVHRSFGWNARMDAVQGAALAIKLPFLDGWNLARQRIAERYLHAFEELTHEVKLPKTLTGNSHVYHSFVIRLPERNRLQDYLRENQIETLIHYPIPCHHQKPYRHLAPKNSLPVTEESSQQLLSLPIYPTLSLDKQRSIIDHLHEACRQKLSA